MPQNRNSETPPKTMTWKKATPLLVGAGVLDALRYMCLFFWFLGPVIGAFVCTVAGSSTYLGKLVGPETTGAVCTVVAGAAGIAGFPIAAALGTIMAIAVGFLGWLMVTAIIFMADSRTFEENPSSLLWVFAGLGASVFVMAWGVYRAQIKLEKATLRKWHKEHDAAQLQERQQRAAELMQQAQEAQGIQEAQLAQEQEVQEAQTEQEEAVNEEESSNTSPGESPAASAGGVSRPVRQQLGSSTEIYLRDRYEGPRRSEQARRLLSQKASLQRDSKTNPEYKTLHSDLREKARTINLQSRESIQKTAAAWDTGNLDISKLASTNNAVVVHAISLDGGSGTSVNNQHGEVHSAELSAVEKGNILLEKRPDISASVIDAGTTIKNQDMLYPFGFIVDGKIVAAYKNDAGTITAGTARRMREDSSDTLQTDTEKQFSAIAHSSGTESENDVHAYNESIVQNPALKGILIDENRLRNSPDMEKGDEVREVFSSDKEAEVSAQYKAKYGDAVRFTKATPKSGKYAGKEVFIVDRKRTWMQKALEFAETNYPHLPVYLRKSDGIYSTNGEKVTAEQIYSTKQG